MPAETCIQALQIGRLMNIKITELKTPLFSVVIF